MGSGGVARHANLAVAVKHHNCTLTLFTTIALLCTGCVLAPDKRLREAVHNPFPQLKRVAVLPFYNQSSAPTVNTDQVAESYYAALQAVPGFEVLPVGVAKSQWLNYSRMYGEPREGADFQRLAQYMGVEAVVVGSVTDFDAYYPPRIAMTTHWYAANPGFHPIPAGYGLPWGTDAEKQIPHRIAQEAEFELARSQLSTQTPLIQTDPPPVSQKPVRHTAAEVDSLESGIMDGSAVAIEQLQGPDGEVYENYSLGANGSLENSFSSGSAGELPQDWPDPTDLIPDPPAAVRPGTIVSHSPVLTHTRLYRGDDAEFTTRLADYVETGDDARPRGWKGYLSRSDDFVRFCCHLHILEMLESRGGRDQSDLILQWPLSRY